MKWNWQQADWPHFTYDQALYTQYEERFLLQSGQILGAFKHLPDEQKSDIHIELIAEESFLTSKIEGEYLDRNSIQSSLRQQFGLQEGRVSQDLREQGVSKMLTDVYRSHGKGLTHDLLDQWHGLLFEKIMDQAGAYRTHSEPIQVVSGALHQPKVHFEAPPSKVVQSEMNAFINWFNQAHQTKQFRPLTIAAISHLWFESIHPYPDGNGRIGRALVEYSLSRSLGTPAIISLSTSIEKKRKNYYDALEKSNKHNSIDDWLSYFIPTLLDAQAESLKTVDFVIQKAQFYDRFRGQLNERQAKVIARIFKEGLEGFKGGLSAGNYLKITQTSVATATRDLSNLVTKGAFTRTGERKSTRYKLNLFPS